MTEMYLVIYVGPAGLRDCYFRLTNKKPDAYAETSGEGNCFIFQLVDGDFSGGMKAAIDTGKVMSDWGNRIIQANLTKTFRRE